MHSSKSSHTVLPVEPAADETLADLVEQAVCAVLPHGACARIAARAPAGFELTEEERQAFVKATAPVYQKWEKRIGADLLKAARDAIAGN